MQDLKERGRFPEGYNTAGEAHTSQKMFRHTRTLASRAAKIKRSALDAIRSRVNFFGYNLLVKQYEYEMLKAGQEFVI